MEDRDEEAFSKYLSLWDWQEGKQSIALESSVAYSKAPHIKGVPKRIYNSGFSSCRFVYMLRDPIKRIESQVRHGLFAGWGKSLETGVPEDSVNFSRYAMQLDQYLEFFSRESIMLITLEEFKSDPHSVLARVCEFLDIDKSFRFADVDKTRNSGDFFNAPENVARMTQSGIGQFIARKILSAKLKTKIRNFIARFHREDIDASMGRWRLTDEERRLVLKELSLDLQRIDEYEGVDIKKYWDIELKFNVNA